MGDLSVNVEWIDEYEIHFVVREGIVTLSAPGEVRKMRTALDSQAFRIETDVLELIEMDEADKLFAWIKLNDLLLPGVGLKFFYDANSLVTEIVRNV